MFDLSMASATGEAHFAAINATPADFSHDSLPELR
jgi:hypothetical protein